MEIVCASDCHDNWIDDTPKLSYYIRFIDKSNSVRRRQHHVNWRCHRHFTLPFYRHIQHMHRQATTSERWVEWHFFRWECVVTILHRRCWMWFVISFYFTSGHRSIGEIDSKWSSWWRFPAIKDIKKCNFGITIASSQLKRTLMHIEIDKILNGVFCSPVSNNKSNRIFPIKRNWTHHLTSCCCRHISLFVFFIVDRQWRFSILCGHHLSIINYWIGGDDGILSLERHTPQNKHWPMGTALEFVWCYSMTRQNTSAFHWPHARATSPHVFAVKLVQSCRSYQARGPNTCFGHRI